MKTIEPTKCEHCENPVKKGYMVVIAPREQVADGQYIQENPLYFCDEKCLLEFMGSRYFGHRVQTVPIGLDARSVADCFYTERKHQQCTGVPFPGTATDLNAVADDLVELAASAWKAVGLSLPQWRERMSRFDKMISE